MNAVSATPAVRRSKLIMMPLSDLPHVRLLRLLPTQSLVIEMTLWLSPVVVRMDRPGHQNDETSAGDDNEDQDRLWKVRHLEYLSGAMSCWRFDVTLSSRTLR